MRRIWLPLWWGFFFSGCVMACDGLQVYGYVEKVTLVQQNLQLSAKLDTGAKSASLNAQDITRVVENGKTWMDFRVPLKQGGFVSFRAEYVGKVAIKPRVGEKDGSSQSLVAPIRRPVVLMPMRLGSEVRVIRVNLTNRKRFNYPLLLGRDALTAFGAVVNPGKSFLYKSGAPTR